MTDDKAHAASPNSASLIDALERDAKQRLNAPTPGMPDAFVRAVTRRRWARRVPATAAVTLALIGIVTLAMSLRDTNRPAPELVDHVPAHREPAPGTLDPGAAPTAAELTRINRGRAGDALILPEAPAAAGESAPEPITAGTRPDSPAAAPVVK